MKQVLAQHPFHIVDPSPWPMFMASGALSLTSGFVMYLHGYSIGGKLTILGFLLTLYTMYVWWRDVVREATFEGRHTKYVQQGLRYGMILFIGSEVMFFVAFFLGILFCKSCSNRRDWMFLATVRFRDHWSLGSSFFKYCNISYFWTYFNLGTPCYD